jgi:D-alanine-D-alanine ligase
MSAQEKKYTVPQHRKVWVLAPHLQTGDANVDYYYDFSQSIQEYTKTFRELNMEWVWQPVTMQNYRDVIDMIEMDEQPSIILNLCDGDEINGTPGISVLRYLHQKKMIYTGASERFYDLTTSKIIMKRAFDEGGIATPAWREIPENDPTLETIFNKLGKPIIVKPAVSGGSMGVGIKSVVSDASSLQQQLKVLFDGYRGWSLTAGGVIAEEYINGPEFTTFIVGDADKRNKAIIYPPVERVFHPALPDNERFLSFDRLWETYDEETPLPNNEPFYTYHRPQEELINAITQLSWDAYVAVAGKGYGRIDLRMDKNSGRLVVLEVNAQCGISEDEDYTSIGAILRLSNTSFSQMVAAILENAIARTRIRKPAAAGAKSQTIKKTKRLVKQG